MKQDKYQEDFREKPLIFGWISQHKNEEVRQYFEYYPNDIHLKGWMGDTALHIACRSGNMEVVRYLIEKGADVNAQRTGVYTTPLCWAVNVEIARYLLENGATTNDLELFVATREDRLEVMESLLKHGAMVNKEEPEYLQCKSTDAIALYLKCGIDINGTDQHGGNLLHQLAWRNLPDVLDFAMQQGVSWRRDSSGRTPYLSAKRGGRTAVAQFLIENYPELLLNRVEHLGINEAYEPISFARKSPENPDIYWALTQDGKLLTYKMESNHQLNIQQAVVLDVAIIRNFTFDAAHQLIVPTGENKLLKLDATSLKILETITFEAEMAFDQITYLPQKQVFIGSSHNWEIVVLDNDFKVLERVSAEDGTFYPIVNDAENLLAFWSYDQASFFNLYAFDEKCRVEYVETFFEDEQTISKALAFVGDKIVVAYPKKIDVFQFQYGKLELFATCPIKEYEADYDVCSLVAVSDTVFMFGKANKIGVYEVKKRLQKIKEVTLPLAANIRQLHFDTKTSILTVITPFEIKAFDLFIEKK